MEYMLLITEKVAHFDDFTKEQWDVLDERHRQFAKKIVDVGGEIVASDPLMAPRPQSRFTPGADGVLVTDGPFAETKEVLLGYYKIRVDSEELARQLAAECPTAGYVDLRIVGIEQG
jgi:hypothetical protein